MAKGESKIIIPDEVIINKIFLIRGKKVMLDWDLADLYKVETKQLKRAVRRNISRFPEDFMIQLTADEFINLRSQIGTSSWGGTRYLPMAFTEHGVIMLASVLNSEHAIQVNIQVVRIFNRMREMLTTNEEIIQKLVEHDNQILAILEHLKILEQSNQQELAKQHRERVGYKRKKEI